MNIVATGSLGISIYKFHIIMQYYRHYDVIIAEEGVRFLGFENERSNVSSAIIRRIRLICVPFVLFHQKHFPYRGE